MFGFLFPRKKTTDGLSERLEPTISIPSTERGTRSTDEARLRALYQQQQPNFDLAAKISDIRRMDQVDGHVKRIHHRTTHALTKGGLMLVNPAKNTRLAAQWRSYKQSVGLDNRSKLSSDARGLMMEGNLVVQFVLDKSQSRVLGAVRMPAETIRAITDESGQFADVGAAFAQYDWLTGRDLATFPRWQMDVARLDPLNFDDYGEPGRPFLDASRKIWLQMQMTFEDLVIRRRERAPMRTAHVLEGADEATLTKYKAQVENEQQVITTNYYLNRKGGVQAVQGDANLDQIADISLLLDAFFSGTPAPKGLFGYADGLSRDILQDMKEEFYDELDILQDLQAWVYQRGFRLHLLLQGLNSDAWDWNVKFAERMTETLNQRTDRSLKQASIGASRHTVFTTAGLDPHAEEQLLAQERDADDPYPLVQAVSKPTVKVTPNNAPKGESATSIGNGA
ncbi:MAG: hypothetical protein BWK73_04525 [Thiothrix lacustris]|uniref:Phage portal protein n=1 Tax=Thiothrix lacustris TaxID=525917 RepID=A0A1Y1QY18_9GAMM|nr:MAG: hypothetical protein BWK73_04525 [Thiothrix lacustris]